MDIELMQYVELKGVKNITLTLCHNKTTFSISVGHVCTRELKYSLWAFEFKRKQCFCQENYYNDPPYVFLKLLRQKQNKTFLVF